MLNHTADAITGAHIYKLLNISLNDPNKLSSLLANQTEIVFKELNNISAITFEMLMEKKLYAIKLITSIFIFCFVIN